MKKRIFIANSTAMLRHAVTQWIITEAEVSASNIVKLKLSNMANEMLNDTWFELAENIENGFVIIEDEIEEEGQTGR